MKLTSSIFILLLAGLVASAQTNKLTSLLQQGLFEEQANRNLDAAIADYQTLATQFDQDRQMAATAVFRLGECYRAQGKTNEAAAQYQRILRDFSDQAMLATLSRQNLAGMGTPLESPASSARQQQKELLAKQIALAEQDLSDTQKQFQVGKATQADVRNAEREVLRLRQQLAALDAGKEELTNLSAPVTSEEDQEIARIQTMIQNSPDLINASSDGTTPLVKAAYNGWFKVAAYLLDHGADVNTACFKIPGSSTGIVRQAKITPLIAAVSAGNKAMTRFLMERGANVNDHDTSGKTLLALAAQKNFPAVVETLLAAHADINARDLYGENTPLFAAVESGQVKMVQRLLAAGADVNLLNNRHETVLNNATEQTPEMMQVLLAAGANPNTKDNSGNTPLIHAANQGKSDVIRLLLAAKADPNSGTSSGSPLHSAIGSKNVDSAEMLLQAGADPNRGTDFKLPLAVAIETRQLSSVQLLLKYKADPNGLMSDNNPLIFMALSDTNILEALLDAGAKVDPVSTLDDLQRTPLCVAANQNNAPAVEILLKHGANPNVCNQNGSTPLHWAAYHLADSKVFELLLANKADPNVCNNNGSSPLSSIKDRLARGDAKEKILAAQIADLLRQHGALDKLPDWDHITVSRPSANFSKTVFYKGTNGWNQFTLLETLLSHYYLGHLDLAFPDLTRVIIVRPNRGSTNETRMVVNLLNSTNGIDGSKDVPLEFGDVVEIPERDHSLGDSPVGLTSSQHDAMVNYLNGTVQLVVRDQKTTLHLEPNGAFIVTILNYTEARKNLLSSSDLSRVKVSRQEPKTGKKHEWTLDCRGNTAPDLWLRNGDVIEVPEKP